MLQRCLRQSVRAVSAATETRFAQQQRTFFRPATSFRPAQQRYFSASRRACAEADAKSEAKDESTEDAAKEDPIAKELEAKKKEAIDLTVRNIVSAERPNY